VRSEGGGPTKQDDENLMREKSVKKGMLRRDAGYRKALSVLDKGVPCGQGKKNAYARRNPQCRPNTPRRLQGIRHEKAESMLGSCVKNSPPKLDDNLSAGTGDFRSKAIAGGRRTLEMGSPIR